MSFPAVDLFLSSLACFPHLKPRLHQIHVVEYTSIPDEQLVSGYKWIQVDTCSRDDNFVADTRYM